MPADRNCRAFSIAFTRATLTNARWNAAVPILSRPAARAALVAARLFPYRVLNIKGGVNMWKSLKVGAALSGVLILGLTGCNQSPTAWAPKGPSLATQA